MGHDGYQQNPTATEIPLAPTGKPYDLAQGQFYALDSNAVINTVAGSTSVVIVWFAGPLISEAPHFRGADVWRSS